MRSSAMASAASASNAAYGDAARLWFQRWRMFWMPFAEMFGYADGQEWLVAHYRFARPQESV